MRPVGNVFETAAVTSEEAVGGPGGGNGLNKIHYVNLYESKDVGLKELYLLFLLFIYL